MHIKTPPVICFKKLLSTCVGVCTFAAFLVCRAPADTYYWDVNGDTSGTGGTGLWLAPNLWRLNSDVGTASSWPNANPNVDTAIFAGTAGGVTIDAPVFANQLQFNGTSGYNISASGSAYLSFSGVNPAISIVNTAAGATTISAPIGGNGGFTMAGNNADPSNRYLVLANANAAVPNNFIGDITVASRAYLRLGGGFLEQIPDTADLYLSGLFDVLTTGNISNGKTERFRDLIINGSQSAFLVDNGTTITVRNITATNTGSGNGVLFGGADRTNSTFPTALPSSLVIEGDLSLANSSVKIVATNSSGIIPGGVVTLYGNLTATGSSTVINTAAINATESSHTLVFSAAAGTSNHTHIINVAAASTLTLAATNPGHTLLVTSANGPATLQKTGPGEWLFTDRALQSSFTGTTDIQQGTLTLGASNRLATASTLSLSGGYLNMQTNSQSIAAVLLNSGSVTGSGTLTATASLLLQQGAILPTLTSPNGLTKSTPGTVTLAGRLTAGPATIAEGQLALTGPALTHTLTSITLAGTDNNWTSRLELTNNLLILTPDPATRAAALATLRNQIITGTSGAAGITSTTTLADPTHKATVAVDNALLHLTTFFGQPVDDNTLLVASTWLGDANLDRKVNVTDLGTLATYYGQSVLNGPLQGDFNNDGLVNVTDLGLLATNYGQGTAPGATFPLDADPSSFSVPTSSFPTPVPEPTTLILLASSALVLHRHARRRQR